MGSRRLQFETKRKWAGFAFVLPWLIGFLVLFLQPLLSTLYYSFKNFSIKDSGGYEILNNAHGFLQHYKAAFTGDPDFIRYFSDSIVRLIYQVPVIVVFSLFIAIILNQKFRGRIIMRSIFFLPVIITSGVIIDIIRGSLGSIALGGNSETGNLFSSAQLWNMMTASGVPETIANFISTAISNIVDTVWCSGIQILIFLSALLSIPSTYYEVASVEGATAWETFWKVTFPRVVPYMLVNIIYTVVDNFSSYTNKVMYYISVVQYKNLDYSYGSALYWIYFISVMVILGVIYFIINRKADYEV